MKLSAQAFDSLALLNIYFFADLAYPGVKTPEQRSEHLRILHKHDLLAEVHDVEDASDEVARLYSEAIEEHAASTMPDDYKPTHDYWGAKCIALNPGWSAPKSNTFFSGDGCGQYMAFDSLLSLNDYTTRCLAEIGEMPQPA